ncbi:MAG: ATP-dependent DNA helicase RecQ [Chitinophagales bacterium]
MLSAHDILRKYWGYSEFRSMQEEVISSVLSGKDTLALLPTGGGKSLCFQVPALCMDGLCIVVSPLIALMKDQVYQLERRGIKAIAIYSGMSKRLIDQTLDNCIYGEIKFLYVSPERLLTDIFLARLKQMKVNLIAVDEAHCISQWGYDFRPPYLEIAKLREFHPQVPILALTATATPQVAVDIQEKLAFKESNLLQKSFLRSNLSYSVLYEDAKYAKLVNILNKVKGSAVVYVRNRRKTKEISDYLNQCKISSAYYHAGLKMEDRSKIQEAWITNRYRVIVATNAFGMGIDKADVRLVIHMDLPDSLEAYFQEAGRAGRDEKKAYAVLLFNLSDKIQALQSLEESMPSIQEIKAVYNALGNFFQLALGSGMEKDHTFDLANFCKQYDFKAIKTLNALKFLEQEQLILLSEGVLQTSKIQILSGKEDLYRFMVENRNFEALIKLLLRSHGGIFDALVKINEVQLAKSLAISVLDLQKALKYLDQIGVLQYEKANQDAYIKYLCGRLPTIDLNLNVEQIEARIAVYKEKILAMIGYASDKSKCRSNMLLAYFGEERKDRCGICDFCLGRNKLEISDLEYQKFLGLLREEMKEPMSLEFIVASIDYNNKEKLLNFLQWLIEYEVLIKNKNDKYFWSEKELH